MQQLNKHNKTLELIDEEIDAMSKLLEELFEPCVFIDVCTSKEIRRKYVG